MEAIPRMRSERIRTNKQLKPSKIPWWKTWIFTSSSLVKKGTNVIATLATVWKSHFFSLNSVEKPLPFCKDTKSTVAEVRNKRLWQNLEPNFRGTLNLASTPSFLWSTVQLWACSQKRYYSYFSPLRVLCAAKRKLRQWSCVRAAGSFPPPRRKQQSASCPSGCCNCQDLISMRVWDNNTESNETFLCYCNRLHSAREQDNAAFSPPALSVWP